MKRCPKIASRPSKLRGEGIGTPAVLWVQHEQGLHGQSFVVGLIDVALCATGHHHVPYRAYLVPLDDLEDHILWKSSGKSETCSTTM